MGKYHSEFHVYWTHQCGDMQHFLFWTKSAANLTTWVFFGKSKFFNFLFLFFFFFLPGGSTDVFCKVSWQSVKLPFSNLQKEMGVAYIMMFNNIHWTHGNGIFECATKCMGVVRQNSLFLIIAPPSGENWVWQPIVKFSAGVMYIPSLVSFGACSGSEKCDHLGRKSGNSKNNRDLASRDLLRP